MAPHIMKGNITISLDKLESGEHTFSATIDYVEYYGKSFLKRLSHISDFDEYLAYVDEKIEIERVGDSIAVTLPVPFSTDIELITMKPKIVNETQQLKIQIMKQRDELEKLRKEIGDTKREKIESEYTNFYLMYSEEKGFYFDHDSFRKHEHANVANVELMMRIYDEYFAPKRGADKSGSNIDTLIGQLNDGSKKLYDTLMYMHCPTVFSHDDPKMIARKIPVTANKTDSQMLLSGVAMIHTTSVEDRKHYLCTMDKLLNGGSWPIIRYKIPNKTLTYRRFTERDLEKRNAYVMDIINNNPDTDINSVTLNSAVYIWH